MKFKVGDKVIGNHPSRYGITKLGWKGVVVNIHNNGLIDVKEDCVDSTVFHRLEPEYFNHVNNDEKIVITHDGKTTTARLFNGKKLVKTATAKCAPEDTFDFMVGVELTMERLTTQEKSKDERLNVKFNTGDFAKIINRNHGHGFKIGTIVKLKKCEIDYFATSEDGVSWLVMDDELEAYTHPKYYNGKVICVDNICNTNNYTVGKIYEFVDGSLISDGGITMPIGKKVTSFEDWCNFSGSKWVKLVE